MAFTRNWDETFPPDTQRADLLGQDIRDFKEDIRERFAAMSGVFADRPAVGDMITDWGAFGANGVLYFATDTGLIYQWNGTAWVDVAFAFSTIAAGFVPVDLFAQVAVIGETTFYTVPASLAGMYRISIDASGSGNIADDVITVIIKNSVSPSRAVDYTFQIKEPFPTFVEASEVMYLQVTASIIYQVTQAGAFDTGSYALHLRVEYLH